MPIKHYYALTNDMITINSPQCKESSITLHDSWDAPPMLEIREGAFYVRGVAVPIDENEATTVYNAFHKWLTWAWMTQDDRR